MAVKVFFCYAREDESLLKKLKAHLNLLQRQGLVNLWHDRDISAGKEWEQEINDHLHQSQIILLLISPAFMASDYCYSVEMKRAMELHSTGKARVIPVIIRPVDNWKSAPFGKLQALPADAKPVTDIFWKNLDRAFHDLLSLLKATYYEVYDLSRTIIGHSLPIWCIAISPDGQFLVSGSDDTTIKIWKTQTGELVRTLKGHLGPVNSVSFDSLRKMLISSSTDQTIKVWNLHTGELLRTLSGHSGQVNSVAIRSDGQILASASDDMTIKLWHVESGQIVDTLNGHLNWVKTVVFDSQGELLVSSSCDLSIKIWRKKQRDFPTLTSQRTHIYKTL